MADSSKMISCSLKKPTLTKISREEVQRTGRQRKRPSFFQDFENEEQNLDKILDEFEQQQIEEAKNPKPKQERKATPGSSRPRRKRELIPEEEEEPESIELETTRSGKKHIFSLLCRPGSAKHLGSAGSFFCSDTRY